MTINLTLYTTDGCHLCDEAKVVIDAVLANSAVTYKLELVDIAFSDELLEQYGVRIPVLKKPNEKSDLGWPFNESQLHEYLNA